MKKEKIENVVETKVESKKMVGEGVGLEDYPNSFNIINT